MKLKTILTTLAAVALLGSGTARAELVNVTTDIAAGTTNDWYATNTYVLRTAVYVRSNAVLNIEAGTVVKGATNVILSRPGIPNAVSALWVTRGGKLNAIGTTAKPIIFTAEGDDVNNPNDMPYNAMGLWGGVVLLGHGQLNSIDPASPKFGGSAPYVDRYEGCDGDGPNGEHLYGGTNDSDSSGILRYVSIRYPGYVFATAKELNGLSMGAVGSGTEIEYVEVLNSQDDGFEFWGGTVNTRHLIAAFCDDDDFDTDAGYRGTNQFWFGIKPTWTGSGDSRGFETDGDYNQAVFNEAPISRWTVYNATLIGRGTGETLATRKTAWSPRDEPAANVVNSIFTEWNSGLRMEGDALYHYTNSPTLGNALNNIWNVINTLDSATTPRGDFLFSDVNRSNTVVNPLLGGISYTNNAGLNPRPQAGSPALSNVLAGAPVPVAYRGAFSGPSDNWADGWTALATMGFLTNATAAPANVINVTTDIAAGTTNDWYATNTYVLRTAVYVRSNAVLNIE
ncbi:MAG: hypothetical protein H7X97_13565, partial [Opitutaceae bacterium]|nr:hypothetical protein [Verrucomicrobiales bacterium]